MKRACREDKRADLRKWDLPAFPRAVFDCPDLRSIDLSSDAIVDESNVYLDEEYWWEVSFDNNGISSIPPEIAEIKNLRILRLGSYDPNEIFEETAERFDLCRNRIAELPPEIGALERLELLDLRYNQMEEARFELTRLLELKELLLEGNPFEDEWMIDDIERDHRYLWYYLGVDALS